MFDIGFWEILLIGVVGLLVVGPERLPELARTIGRWVGQAQRMVRSVRSDIERELESENLRGMISQQKDQIRELKDIVDEVRDDARGGLMTDTLKNEFTSMQQQLDDSRAEITQTTAANSSTQPPAAGSEATAEPAEPPAKN